MQNKTILIESILMLLCLNFRNLIVGRIDKNRGYSELPFIADQNVKLDCTGEPCRVYSKLNQYLLNFKPLHKSVFSQRKESQGMT